MESVILRWQICRNVTEKVNAVGTTQRQLVQQRDIKQKFAGHKRMPVFSTICCWQDKQAPDVNFFFTKENYIFLFYNNEVCGHHLNRFSSALPSIHVNIIYNCKMIQYINTCSLLHNLCSTSHKPCLYNKELWVLYLTSNLTTFILLLSIINKQEKHFSQ